MAIEITNANSPQPVQSKEPLTTGPAPAVSQVNSNLPVNTPALTEVNEQEPALEVTVSNINDFVQNIQRSIQFSVSESTGRTIIKVYDAVTEELIREIPSEELQRISKAIEEQISAGLLLKVNI